MSVTVGRGVFGKSNGNKISALLRVENVSMGNQSTIFYLTAVVRLGLFTREGIY